MPWHVFVSGFFFFFIVKTMPAARRTVGYFFTSKLRTKFVTERKRHARHAVRVNKYLTDRRLSSTLWHTIRSGGYARSFRGAVSLWSRVRQTHVYRTNSIKKPTHTWQHETNFVQVTSRYIVRTLFDFAGRVRVPTPVGFQSPLLNRTPIARRVECYNASGVAKPSIDQSISADWKVDRFIDSGVTEGPQTPRCGGGAR